MIDPDLPGAYQVEVADVNGDGKPDIVALGGGTVAWYENPGWTKRIITGPDRTPGVISSATRDLDGDGKAEVAIAYEFEMNEPSKGELLLAIQGDSPDDPWTVRPLGHFGSIHRLRWGDVDNDGLADLVVAPIFGEGARPPAYDQAPAKLVALHTDARIEKAADWAWSLMPLAERPVLHAIEVNEPVTIAPDPLAALGPPTTTVLTADNLGVAGILFDRKMALDPSGLIVGDLVSGAEGTAPNRGASEIHAGRLRPGSFGEGVSPTFFATIEPWHGNVVAVWHREVPPEKQAEVLRGKPVRTVIDDTLDAGHALWTADVDGDGDDEIFAGHRGNDRRVSAYDWDGSKWVRTILDREVAAQDLRGGDLNGDGRPDVVAVGGSTHNVIWYRPLREDDPGAAKP